MIEQQHHDEHNAHVAQHRARRLTLARREEIFFVFRARYASDTTSARIETIASRDRHPHGARFSAPLIAYARLTHNDLVTINPAITRPTTSQEPTSAIPREADPVAPRAAHFDESRNSRDTTTAAPRWSNRTNTSDPQYDSMTLHVGGGATTIGHPEAIDVTAPERRVIVPGARSIHSRDGLGSSKRNIPDAAQRATAFSQSMATTTGGRPPSRDG